MQFVQPYQICYLLRGKIRVWHYPESTWMIYCTKYTPRYRISDTQGNLWPVKLVIAAQIII